MQNRSKCAAYAVTALRDEQIPPVTLCYDTITSNGQQAIKRNILVQDGAVQRKQLYANDLTVFDLDAVVIICAERGSQIPGSRPIIG